MADKDIICQNCGTVGRPVKAIKGSIFIEIFLWICFLIPGVIYSIWRLTTKSLVCEKCKAADLVPIDTPRGNKLLAEFGHRQADRS